MEHEDAAPPVGEYEVAPDSESCEHSRITKVGLEESSVRMYTV
jgi:hypothetical protein